MFLVQKIKYFYIYCQKLCIQNLKLSLTPSSNSNSNSNIIS